jgi:hypothetical protein
VEGSALATAAETSAIIGCPDDEPEWAEQHRVWRAAHDLRREIGQLHGSELPIDQLDKVAIVDQRAANAEEAEWRQLLLRNAASDRRMGDVDQKNVQGRQPVLSESTRSRMPSKEDKRPEEETMDGLEARLVQYRVLADHRLHFSRLYFQVVGTMLALVAGAATVIAIGRPEWWTAMLLLAGVLLMGTGFVAHRLHHQEERHASALREIEKEESGMIQLPGAQWYGARQLVVVALVAAGLLLSIEALRHMV